MHNTKDDVFGLMCGVRLNLQTRRVSLIYSQSVQIGKKSLICLEGKLMTYHWEDALLFRSSQQLPGLRFGPLKGFLS